MGGTHFKWGAGHHCPPAGVDLSLADMTFLVIGILMYISAAVCFSEVIFPAFDL